MNELEFKNRTKLFALAVIRLVENLPRNRTCDVIGRQLLRCATSVGANYRAACRARSKAEFVAKMGIVEEEADESLYWMEMLVESGAASTRDVQFLMQEGNELLSMTVASIQTMRQKIQNPQSKI